MVAMRFAALSFAKPAGEGTHAEHRSIPAFLRALATIAAKRFFINNFKQSFLQMVDNSLCYLLL